MNEAASQAALRIPLPRRPPINRPTVLANFASTWDARVTTRNHTPADFSSALDKQRLLAVRAVGDAVMAGHGTVRADNMSMGLSDDALRAERVARGQREYPVRVIVSNGGRIDSALKVFAHTFSPIVIFSTQAMPSVVRSALEKRADLHLFNEEQVDLLGALKILRRDYAVRSLVCEGGPSLFRSLLELNAIDDLFLTLCPRVFGGIAAPSVTGPAGEFLQRCHAARLLEMIPAGDECFTHYRLPRKRVHTATRDAPSV